MRKHVAFRDTECIQNRESCGPPEREHEYDRDNSFLAAASEESLHASHNHTHKKKKTTEQISTNWQNPFGDTKHYIMLCVVLLLGAFQSLTDGCVKKTVLSLDPSRA